MKLILECSKKKTRIALCHDLYIQTVAMERPIVHMFYID